MSQLSTLEKYSQREVVDFWREFSQEGLQACEEIMLERYAPPAPARILDLGCGSGRAGLALEPRGYGLTGLDLSWEMLCSARELFTQVRLPSELVQADLRALPCVTASYDIAIVFIAALQHIPTQAARQKTFGEIARVLRPEGVLILALDNLAPALTCYAWWGWNRLRSNPPAPAGREPVLSGARFRAQSKEAGGEGSSADALLESRRSTVGALTWHARGMMKTLRWRTWTGAIDLTRSANSGVEIGDTAIDQVSLMPTRGQVYYHIYRHDELVADAAVGGLELLGYHSGRELTEGKTFAPRVRQLDKQVLYAFRRRH